MFILEDWRIKFDKNEKTVDGTAWYWCKHHVMDGVYDRLYVKHPENKHDEWVERKKGWKREKCTTNFKTPNQASEKLILSNDLKAAMITNFKCTEAEANTLWPDVAQNSTIN